MTEVRRAEQLARYELLLEGELVGHADYLLAEGAVVLTHVETDPARAGQGLASTLVEGVLLDLRSRGLQVVPQCSFAAGYISKNPQWQDLLVEPGQLSRGMSEPSARVGQIT